MKLKINTKDIVNFEVEMSDKQIQNIVFFVFGSLLLSQLTITLTKKYKKETQ